MTNAAHAPLSYGRLSDAKTQIRLLKPMPSFAGIELCFELTSVDLKSSPPFYAISYTWGDSTNSEAISVDGTVFFVSRNCHYALWQARLHDPASLLWIDSVCIDQLNLREKSAQVQMMGDIYKTAAHVLACVGCHHNDSELLVFFASEAEWHLRTQTFSSAYQKDSSFGIAWSDEMTAMRFAWAFKAFGDRSYWKRLWIVQEISNASHVTILCGQDVLAWSSLEILRDLDSSASLFLGWDSERLYHSPHFEAFTLINDIDSTIENLIHWFRDFECEDPRDRIYGLLGLVESPEVREFLAADYTLSKLELALKVIKMISFAGVPELLDALKLSAWTDEIKLLMQQRKDAGSAVRLRRSHRSKTVRRLNNDRRQIAYIEGLPDVQTTLSGDTLPEGALTVSGTRFRCLPNRLYSFELFPRTKRPVMPMKILLKNDSVVAEVCRDSRSGDVLVPFDSQDGRLFLILRPRRGEIYDVVGQGYALEGFTLCPGASECTCSSLKCTRLTAGVAIDVTPEDILALWVSESNFYDPLEQLQKRMPQLEGYVCAGRSAARVSDIKDEQITDGSRQVAQ